MPAKPSRLQLDAYFLKELYYLLRDNLEKVPGKKTHPKALDLEIGDLTTPIDEAGRKWRCELTVSSKSSEEDNFYDFRIVMIGFFTVDKTLSKETAEVVAKANCPAVLYSASREIIATVTRRSPYPGTLLPTVTFIEEPTSPEKKKAKKTTS